MSDSYFRNRAAEARAMARLGRDPYLQKLLLEVSRDLEAEAALIAAGLPADRRESSRLSLPRAQATIFIPAAAEEPRHCHLVNLSAGGACLIGEAPLEPGERVVLRPFPCGPYLAGLVLRSDRLPSGECELALTFDTDTITRERVSLAMAQLAMDATPAANEPPEPADRLISPESLGAD